MLRSFFTFITLLTFPFLLMVLIESHNPVTQIYHHFNVKYLDYTYGGVFALVEKRLLKTPKKEWEQVFETWQQGFGYQVRFIPFEDLKYSDEIKTSLKNSELAYVSDNTPVLMKAIKNTSLVMEIALEQQKQESIERDLQGVILLIEQLLKPVSKDKWISKIEMLNLKSSINIGLLPLSQLSFTKQQQQMVLNNKVVLQESDDREMYYWRLFDTNNIISIGPIPKNNINFEIYVSAVVLFAIVTSMTILLWLFPIWRSLKHLDKTAATFGKGILNQRVNVKPYTITAQLGRSFNVMAEKIQKLIQTNQELTNAIAHDLRTPLAKMRFAIEMLETEENSQEEKQLYKKSVSKNIDNLDYLLNQVLLYTRYNRIIKLTPSTLGQFANMIEEEVEEQRFLHENLTFECHIEDCSVNKDMLLDTLSFSRALTNLLNNATKFAQTTIHIHFYQQENNCFLVVEDDGMGINEGQINDIFEPFKQLNNQERDTKQGHGLGLAIVAQIAKWHSGDVIVNRSKILGGAQFIIKWPQGK